MKIGDFLLFSKGKDGGPESKVQGYWLIQIKSLFAIALLRFDEGSRDAYHSHAFNSVSWVLRGKLDEHLTHPDTVKEYVPSFKPIHTYRNTFHKVYGRAKHTWVFTLRGPWVDTWIEHTPDKGVTLLTHNRVEVK
jgi:hypothetical protein